MARLQNRGVKAVKRSESVQGNGREGSFGSVGPLLVVCSFDAGGEGLARQMWPPGEPERAPTQGWQSPSR